MHILGRGQTHLPFALPKFDTPCAALEAQAAPTGEALARMMGMEKQ